MFFFHVFQHPYGWDIQSQDADEIISYVKRNLKNRVSMLSTLVLICVVLNHPLSMHE